MAADPPARPSIEPTQIIVLGVAALVAIVLGSALRAVTFGTDVTTRTPGLALGGSIDDLTADPVERTLDPYMGHGAWVDAFDYVPAYSNGEPSLRVESLAEMADAGVRTVYLQAARDDDRALGLIVDPSVVAQWLIEAHRLDLAVVAWFLPRHVDTDADLAHLEALHDFEVLGHTFDGIAVDIEATTVENAGVRSAELASLSSRFREVAGGDPVGAIVLPPVLLEVVNPDFWPGFPWAEIAPHYDVWLPMTYWSQRTTDSGYQDGFSYLEESSRRLRANLGDEDALIHGIGGIGDELTDEALARFGEALTVTNAIGGSVYDWRTLPPAQRVLVGRAVGD